MSDPTEDLIVRIETEVRAWETTRDDGSSGLAFEGLLTEAAQALRALQQALEPFAKFAEIADADGQLWTDQSSIAEVMGSAIRHTISYGDLRRARSALTGSAQG